MHYYLMRFCGLLLLFSLYLVQNVNASIAPAPGGNYTVSYNINLGIGTSNGNDITDVFIFEWDSSNFNVDYPFTINSVGQSVLQHTISFQPTHALILGYNLGIAGVGDEKDHLFSVTNETFFASVQNKKWSVAFPGVVPGPPRTGHSLMVTLLKDAASGDTTALTYLKDFVEREATHAAFNPATNGFRVIEWTAANPIDYNPQPVPSLSVWSLGMLAGLVGLIGLRKQIKSRQRRLSTD